MQTLAPPFSLTNFFCACMNQWSSCDVRPGYARDINGLMEMYISWLCLFSNRCSDVLVGAVTNDSTGIQRRNTAAGSGCGAVGVPDEVGMNTGTTGSANDRSCSVRALFRAWELFLRERREWESSNLWLYISVSLSVSVSVSVSSSRFTILQRVESTIINCHHLHQLFYGIVFWKNCRRWTITILAFIPVDVFYLLIIKLQVYCHSQLNHTWIFIITKRSSSSSSIVCVEEPH